MAGPLEGIRIIDLSQVVAGPVCTMLLAEQGAEVIKVEFPDQGDILRHNRHFAKNDVNSLTLNCNRGKKSVAIDMTTPEGAALIEELAADADVFIRGYAEQALPEAALSPTGTSIPGVHWHGESDRVGVAVRGRLKRRVPEHGGQLRRWMDWKLFVHQ